MWHDGLMPTSGLLDEERLKDAVRRWNCTCGREVARLRKERGWRQPQLAELAGIATQTVSKVELGLIVPTESVRLALAFALMVEVDKIWPPLSRDRLDAVARVRGAA